jgi:hypothetical protein
MSKTRIKIKTDSGMQVHFDTHINNYTLCGLETSGDETCGLSEGIITNRKVDCPDCIRIIRFCKEIKSTEIKKQP